MYINYCKLNKPSVHPFSKLRMKLTVPDYLNSTALASVETCLLKTLYHFQVVVCVAVVSSCKSELSKRFLFFNYSFLARPPAFNYWQWLSLAWPVATHVPVYRSTFLISGCIDIRQMLHFLVHSQIAEEFLLGTKSCVTIREATLGC